MRKTFQQFLAENPHFVDVQGMRESSDHGAYLRNALEKAWQAGYEAGNTPNEILAGPGEPTKHADISAADRPGVDKRLGATGTPVE